MKTALELAADTRSLSTLVVFHAAARSSAAAVQVSYLQMKDAL
jgi:hypothetical protein